MGVFLVVVRNYSVINQIFLTSRQCFILMGRKKTIYPDFTILNRHTGVITYWEHAGRMDDTYYANEFVRKMNTYIANELLPGRDVVVSFESQNSPLDIKVVKRLVEQIVNKE